jgi:hypothetical protein
MKGVIGTVLACLTSAAAFGTVAIAQTSIPSGENLEIGAKVCSETKMLHETADQYKQRKESERYTPSWIWKSLTSMNGTPDTMSFTFKVADGQRVLQASALIDAQAAKNLEAALTAYAPVHEVWLNSPGGNSRVGVEMGAILRKHQVLTRIRSGDGCASACSTAFLGGVMRDVEPGAAYGVHMYTTQIDTTDVLDQDTFNTVQWGGAQGAAERVAYVQKMGVGLKWLQLWSDTAPGCMTFMSQSEMRSAFVNNLR